MKASNETLYFCNATCCGSEQNVVGNNDECNWDILLPIISFRGNNKEMDCGVDKITSGTHRCPLSMMEIICSNPNCLGLTTAHWSFLALPARKSMKIHHMGKPSVCLNKFSRWCFHVCFLVCVFFNPPNDTNETNWCHVKCWRNRFQNVWQGICHVTWGDGIAWKSKSRFGLTLLGRHDDSVTKAVADVRSPGARAFFKTLEWMLPLYSDSPETSKLITEIDDTMTVAPGLVD